MTRQYMSRVESFTRLGAEMELKEKINGLMQTLTMVRASLWENQVKVEELVEREEELLKQDRALAAQIGLLREMEVKENNA